MSRRLVRRLFADPIQHAVEHFAKVKRRRDAEADARIDGDDGLVVGVHVDRAESEADVLMEHSRLGANVRADRLNMVGVRKGEPFIAKGNLALSNDFVSHDSQASRMSMTALEIMRREGSSVDTVSIDVRARDPNDWEDEDA